MFRVSPKQAVSDFQDFFNLLSQTCEVNIFGCHDCRYSSENDRMTTFIETDSTVYHMEPDLHVKGTILYSDYCALKTTDGITSTTIAGHATTCYHHLGVGLLARFDFISGFRQVSPSQVLVSDFYNCCLKLIDRITLQVTRYAGYCGSMG